MKQVSVGDKVRVKIANVHEYGIISDILNEEIIIYLNETFFKVVSIEDFNDLSYEVVN